MRADITLSTILMLSASAACTYVRELPDDPVVYAPRPVAVVDRWRVHDDGKELGFLVLLEIQDPSGPIRFYRVENIGRQWMGHVALDGRFSRRVPFQDEEEDLGIHPMRSGLAVIYQVDDPVELTKLGQGAAEAATPRVDRR